MSKIWEQSDLITPKYQKENGLLDIHKLRNDNPELGNFRADWIIAVMATVAAGIPLDSSIEAEQWLKLRGCGKGFIEELVKRGWSQPIIPYSVRRLNAPKKQTNIRRWKFNPYTGEPLT